MGGPTTAGIARAFPAPEASGCGRPVAPPVGAEREQRLRVVLPVLT
ncbi:hypothetical protein [Kitasatospora sp. NPDC004531]